MRKTIITILTVLFLVSGCATKTDTDQRLTNIQQRLDEFRLSLENSSKTILEIQVPEYVDPNIYMEGAYKTILERFKALEALYMNSYAVGIFCCGSTNLTWGTTETTTSIALLTMPYEVEYEGAYPEDFKVTEDTDYDLVFSYQDKPIISYLAKTNRYLEVTHNTLPVFDLGNGFSVITIIHDQSIWSEADKTIINAFINKLILKGTVGRS